MEEREKGGIFQLLDACRTAGFSPGFSQRLLWVVQQRFVSGRDSSLD